MGKKRKRRRRKQNSGLTERPLFEGVLTKNQNKYAVVLRKSDGELQTVVKNAEANPDKPIKKIPFVRGVFALFSETVLVLESLEYSSEIYGNDTTEEKVLDKILSKLFGKHTNRIVAAVTAVVSFVFCLLFITAIPILLAHFLERYIINKSVIHIIEFAASVFIMLLYLFSFFLFKDVRRMIKYHGAAHMCINCIERGRKLTYKNVSSSSRFLYRSPGDYIIFCALISVILFVLVRIDSVPLRILFRILYLPLATGLFYEFYVLICFLPDCLLRKILSLPAFPAQFFTAGKPDDEMISTAMASLDAVFDWREFLVINFPDKYSSADFGLDKKKNPEAAKEELKGKKALENEIEKEFARVDEELTRGEYPEGKTDKSYKYFSESESEDTYEYYSNEEDVAYRENEEYYEEENNRVYVERRAGYNTEAYEAVYVNQIDEEYEEYYVDGDEYEYYGQEEEYYEGDEAGYYDGGENADEYFEGDVAEYYEDATADEYYEGDGEEYYEGDENTDEEHPAADSDITEEYNEDTNVQSADDGFANEEQDEEAAEPSKEGVTGESEDAKTDDSKAGNSLKSKDKAGKKSRKGKKNIAKADDMEGYEAEYHTDNDGIYDEDSYVNHVEPEDVRDEYYVNPETEDEDNSKEENSRIKEVDELSKTQPVGIDFMDDYGFDPEDEEVDVHTMSFKPVDESDIAKYEEESGFVKESGYEDEDDSDYEEGNVPLFSKEIESIPMPESLDNIVEVMPQGGVKARVFINPEEAENNDFASDFEEEDIDFDNIIDEHGHLTLRDTDAFNRMLDEEYDEIFKRLGLDQEDI